MLKGSASKRTTLVPDEPDESFGVRASAGRSRPSILDGFRRANHRPSVCRSAASTPDIGIRLLARSISESAIVARLSVITMESVSNPVCRPSGVFNTTMTRLE